MDNDDLEKLNTRESINSIIKRLTIESKKNISDGLSAVDAVKFRMEQYGLNQKQFSKIIGMSEPNFSEFITGKRKLTRKSIKKCVAIGVLPMPLINDL